MRCTPWRFFLTIDHLTLRFDAHQGAVKKFEYLGVIETEFENTLACLSGAQMGSKHEKNLRSKFSWHTPFKAQFIFLRASHLRSKALRRKELSNEIVSHLIQFSVSFCVIQYDSHLKTKYIFYESDSLMRLNLIFCECWSHEIITKRLKLILRE